MTTVEKEPAPGGRRQPHVVMAVASGILRDARVRKTALAVAEAGYRVTLLWGDHEGSAVVEGTLGPVRTIGLPVPYVLRDARTRREARRRAWRPAWPSYRDKGQVRTATVRLAAAAARVEGRGIESRAVLRARRSAHRARSALFPLQERAFARLWRHLDARSLRPERLSRWRQELANIADLEAAFTTWLWRLEPEILHIHDIHLLGAGVQAKRRLTSRGRPVTLVYDAHEYLPGMTGVNPKAEAAYQAMELDLIGEIDAMITVSESIADALQQRYALAHRPTVVLNTPPRASAVTGEQVGGVREAAGVPDGVPLLVYSGVLGHQRNVGAVITALAELPGVHFACVCVPSAHHPAPRALAALATQLGVDDRVHLVDPVLPEAISGFLASADVGVHPMVSGLANHEMALPNKLFDYIFAGLPVVVSDVAEMRRFVTEHGVGATFDPGDPDDLARAVRDVLADSESFRRAVRSPELLDMYCWDEQARRLRELYSTLLEA